MFTTDERTRLLSIARRSIQEGLVTRHHWHPEPADLSATLLQKGASFVTLHIRGHLRGCIGSIEATLPLAEDVADNAFRSAFKDPRFAPLSPAEFAELEIDLSVLTPPRPLSVSSEGELLAHLRPGIDGLILDCQDGRATYLPDVWQTLPDPHAFIDSLKKKAGLPTSYPAENIRWSVYQTEKI